MLAMAQCPVRPATALPLGEQDLHSEAIALGCSLTDNARGSQPTYGLADAKHRRVQFLKADLAVKRGDVSYRRRI